MRQVFCYRAIRLVESEVVEALALQVKGSWNLWTDRAVPTLEGTRSDVNVVELYSRVEIYKSVHCMSLAYPTTTMTAPTRNELKAAAQSFCEAFAEKKGPDTILTFFSSKEPISAIEYGEKDLAPFLGRRFEGEQGVRDYLGLVGSLLAFDEMSFSEYVVDSEERKVAVKGRCAFEWKETRESWDETFAYVLDFDNEAKVVRYQIWADSGAAYLARSASLQSLRKNPKNVV